MPQPIVCRRPRTLGLGVLAASALLLTTGVTAVPGRAAVNSPGELPGIRAGQPAKAIPGGRVLIRIRGSRFGRSARITVIGYSGGAAGVRRTVRVRKTRTVRHLPPGRYRVRARNVYNKAGVSRWQRVSDRRIRITRSRGARTTVTYARDSWERRALEAGRIARARPGRVSFAVADKRGRIVAARNPHNRVNAASVIKSLFLAAYLRSRPVAGRALTSSERSRLSAMIRWSSNDAATRTRRLTGYAAVDQVAADAGMTDFRQRPAWGLSQISAADMARFFARLDKLIPARHLSFALGLFNQITPAHRWGIPQESPPGWVWRAKGGWLDRVVNQAGRIERGKHRIAMAVLIEGTPGIVAHVGTRPRPDTGPTTIEKVAHRLLRPGVKYL